jgi:hypothetical protein
MLPDGANLPKVLLAEAMKLPDKDAELALGKRAHAIGDEARSQSAEMSATMVQAPGGAEYAATLQTAITKLAQLYAMRGEGNDGTAVKRAAADVFYDHFETMGTLRLPKRDGVPIVPASGVREMQDQVIAALPKLDLVVPSGAPGTTETQRRDALLRNVRSFGYWMTTADDKGMMLLAGPGLPVRFADGRPLIVPFDSVTAAMGDAGAQANYQSRWRPGATAADMGADPAPAAAGVPGFLRDQHPAQTITRQRRQAPADPTAGLKP